MNAAAEEEEIAADSPYSIEELDPLTDPLELDNWLQRRSDWIEKGQ